MKKYSGLFSKKCLFAILVLMFSSCSEDILNETPLDFFSPENAFNSLAGIRQGINGLYCDVRSLKNGLLEGSLGSDVCYNGENPGGNTQMVNYITCMIPTDINLGNLWNSFYSLIQKANVVIEGINNSDDAIWASDAQKNAYLAEAMLFRAFGYRYLVMLWGDVPLVTEAIHSIKIDLVRAPKADVFKLMEEDLIFGIANLPEPGEEENVGRINQGVAAHLLCETYINQAYLNPSKFQLAVDAASKVIDGYNYALMTERFGSTVDVFGSGDVFLDLFAYGNQYLPENRECIWAVQFEPFITGGYRNMSEYFFGPAYFRLGNAPDGKKAIRGDFVDGAYTGYSDTLGRCVSYFRPTSYAAYFVWRSDWYNDIRNAKHNIKRDFYFDNPESIYDKQKIDFSLYPPGTRDPIHDTCSYIYPYFIGKVGDPLHHFTEPKKAGAGRNHKDKYVIRLAETLLLRAEAYVNLGRLDLAAADINKIRNRANATPVLPADVNLDYILDERVRELYSEECRYITLRRMGNMVERTQKYCDNPIFPGANIKDHNVLYPIPQTEIDLNIDAVIQQNPGY